MLLNTIDCLLENYLLAVLDIDLAFLWVSDYVARDAED